MKKHLRKKLIILLGGAALFFGSLCPAAGQLARSPRVRVYNPGSYQRTRSVMSRRAALRKILKKKRQRATKRHRHN